jgi:hypothetical protein
MKEKKSVGLVWIAILDIAVLVFSLFIIGAVIVNAKNIQPTNEKNNPPFSLILFPCLFSRMLPYALTCS